MPEKSQKTQKVNLSQWSTVPPVSGGQADEVIVKTGKLFYVGTHKGKKYTRRDIESILAAWSAGQRIPVQLDHSSSARDTVGYVKNLWADGDVLMGELEIRGTSNVEQVRLGLWKNVSVGIEFPGGNPRLYEVSITPLPALEQAEIFSRNGGTIMDENKEKTIATEESTEENHSESAIVEAVRHAATVQAEQMTDRAEMARMKSEMETLRAQMSAVEVERDTLAAEKRAIEDERHIDELVQLGKSTAAMKTAELNLWRSLDAEGRKLYMAVKEVSPLAWHPGVAGEAHAEKPNSPAILSDDRSREIVKYAKGGIDE